MWNWQLAQRSQQWAAKNANLRIRPPIQLTRRE
jgi:hypothetical protein